MSYIDKVQKERKYPDKISFIHSPDMAYEVYAYSLDQAVEILLTVKNPPKKENLLHVGALGYTMWEFKDQIGSNVMVYFKK